jgi:hypothetical protein
MLGLRLVSCGGGHKLAPRCLHWHGTDRGYAESVYGRVDGIATTQGYGVIAHDACCGTYCDCEGAHAGT